MKKRKPYNPMKRYLRERKALLRQYKVAVVSLAPEGRQMLVNLATGKPYAPGRSMVEAVADIAHRWTVYIAALCVDNSGQRYIKAVEIEPDGIYISDTLAEVIEQQHKELCDGCNQRHLVGSIWIASPSGVSLSEEQADRIIEAVGAWSQSQGVAA